MLSSCSADGAILHRPVMAEADTIAVDGLESDRVVPFLKVTQLPAMPVPSIRQPSHAALLFMAQLAQQCAEAFGPSNRSRTVPLMYEWWCSCGCNSVALTRLN